MSGGQRTGNFQSTLSALVSKREKLLEDLRLAEKQGCISVIADVLWLESRSKSVANVKVYDLETAYLHDSSQFGSVLKGFEGFLSSSKSAGNLKRSRKFQPEDRLFSLSSVTSPVEEHVAGRDPDGRTDGLQGRNKSTGAVSNGPGKQKRGRTGPREGKRLKQGNEQELEEEDDVEVVQRQSLN